MAGVYLRLPLRLLYPELRSRYHLRPFPGSLAHLISIASDSPMMQLEHLLCSLMVLGWSVLLRQNRHGEIQLRKGLALLNIVDEAEEVPEAKTHHTLTDALDKKHAGN